MEFIYRLEYYSKGPFCNKRRYRDLRSRILQSYKIDHFGTTFLNYYDNRNDNIPLDPEHQRLIHDTYPGKAWSGFKSLETLLDEFGASGPHYSNTLALQFHRAFEQIADLHIGIYLADPIYEINREVLFLRHQATMVQRLRSVDDIHQLRSKEQ